MERVVFLDRASLPAELRPPQFPHEWSDYPQTAPDDVVGRLQGASIAITNKVPLCESALARLPALRMIAACATGTDNIDVAYCRARGIVVSNIRNYAVHSVPEHVFMMVLALRRNLLAYRGSVTHGEWRRSEQFCLLAHPIGDIHGATLGVVGYGVLGQAVARLAQAFGMQVLVAEHKDATGTRPGFTPFSRVLAESDVLTLHAPLTPRTRHLIGRAELRAMRREALLINCGRGGVVDEHALAEALDTGWIAGAGIDVLSREPPGDNPLLSMERPNLIVTPHVAWAGTGAIRIMAAQLIANIEAFVAGRPANVVGA